MSKNLFKSRSSLFLRNLLFTILHPGLVAGLIPHLIVSHQGETSNEAPSVLFYLGAIIFITGCLIVLFCIIELAVRGAGTLSPADPTQKLVISGLYRLSRNPMYIGVTMVLIGEAISTQSRSLWIYTALVFVAFYVFVRYKEEPRLKKDFGSEFYNYTRKVRRWV